MLRCVLPFSSNKSVLRIVQGATLVVSFLFYNTRKSRIFLFGCVLPFSNNETRLKTACSLLLLLNHTKKLHSHKRNGAFKIFSLHARRQI